MPLSKRLPQEPDYQPSAAPQAGWYRPRSQPQQRDKPTRPAPWSCALRSASVSPELNVRRLTICGSQHMLQHQAVVGLAAAGGTSAGRHAGLRAPRCAWKII